MKNRFTTEDAAMILIDHQQGTIKLARNIPHEQIIMNARARARRGGNQNAAHFNEQSGDGVSGTDD